MSSMTAENTKDIFSSTDAFVSAVEAMREKNPRNRMARHFPIEYFKQQDPQDQKEIMQIVGPGLLNSDSEVGAYARRTTDYDDYAPVLEPIIKDYHSLPEGFSYSSDWNIEGTNLDLKDIDPELSEVSMRVRVARNVEGWPMTPSMTREDRVNFEEYMVENGFADLIVNGARYVSLTPGSRYEITPEEYQKLVDEHKMFKDMSADPHLASAGISNDWPYGRGMLLSAGGDPIAWIGEEDHLRIMNMKKGSDLAEVFNGLSEVLSKIEEAGVKFARSEKYGNVTTCPSNLGSGMRASLHLKLPRLTRDGTDVDALKKVLENEGLNVSVRGAGGEHTAPGAGGLVDISPRGRMIPEAEVIRQLHGAAAKLIALEKNAAV